MATSPDYTILAAPRISEATFAGILRSARSPAAAEAAACYRAFVAAGVDPAVALGVFRKESSFGTAGRATRNRSWGNIRGRQAGYPVDSGNFRIYPSWTAGAADAARLLAIYGRNQIRPGTNTSTVQTFPFVWAPSSDGNAPDGYGDALASWIKQWSGQAGSSVVGSGTTTSSPSPTPPMTGTTTTPVECRAVFLETFHKDPARVLDQWTADQWVNYLIEQRGTGGFGLIPLFGATGDDISGIIDRATAALTAAIQPHVGKTRYGDLPARIAVALPDKLADNSPEYVLRGLAEIMRNGVVLSAIAAVIVLALYLLVRDGAAAGSGS